MTQQRFIELVYEAQGVCGITNVQLDMTFSGGEKIYISQAQIEKTRQRGMWKGTCE